MEEKIRFFCPNCSAEYVVPQSAAGKDAACKNCNQRITVPHPAHHAPEKRASASATLFESASPTPDKPWKVTAIGGMRIGSGICNCLAGLLFFWLFIPLLLIPLGIVEIVSAANLLKKPPKQPANPKAIAILEIVGILTLAGWVPLVVGILSLVWLADDRVKQYLASLE